MWVFAHEAMHKTATKEDKPSEINVFKAEKHAVKSIAYIGPKQ